MRRYNYSEKDLQINLGDLAHETIRELYVAARKVSIYSRAHPLAQKAIGRLFLQMEQIFKYKKYFNIHIDSGLLYALNIRLQPSLFCEQIINYMQIPDISDILFEESMTAEQLGLFLEFFTKRAFPGVKSNPVAEQLEQGDIDTIHINSETGDRLFTAGEKFTAAPGVEFSLRYILKRVIGPELERLAAILCHENADVDAYIDKYDIDYYPQLINYIIPEQLSVVETDAIIGLFREKLIDINIVSGGGNDEESFIQIKSLMNGLSLHPDRGKIFSGIEAVLADKNIEADEYSDLIPAASAVRIESSEKINQFLYATFNRELPGHDLEDFADLFGRILRTGQRNRVVSVVNILITHLAGPHFDLRENALILFRQVLGLMQELSADYLMDHVIDKVDEYISEGRESFEFSDLIWEIIRVALSHGDYARLSRLCTTLSKKCDHNNGICCFESVAVKKSIEELNRPEVIDKLIAELVNGQHNHTPYIRNILTTIGSREAAYALASIISHESRYVRMQVLKILSDMGKAALSVCSQILEDDAYFERESGRREIPDESWYIVRNAIFVLGALEDTDGCRALRHRISEEDTRVRLAIVSALEKIGGELAADLLIIIADDADREIREAAIIALGFIGQVDIVPELIDLAGRRNGEMLKIIVTLGKLGGGEARYFLSQLLTDPEVISQYTSGRSSRDEIKMAAIKALGQIGDSDSMKAVKNFKDSLSSTQKILFGGSKLSKAVDDILDHRSR